MSASSRISTMLRTAPPCELFYDLRSYQSLMTSSFSQIDSIPPNYPCNGANNIRNAFQSVPAWTDHLQQNADLKARLDATLGTAGLADWASWCKFYH